MKVFASAALCLGLVGCGAPPIPTPSTPQPTPPAAISQPTYAGPKIRVAVGRFQTLPEVQKLLAGMGWADLGPTLTAQITGGLVKTGRVVVLERAQIKTVIGNTRLEQEGSMAKYFDQKTTVESGKLQGAQAVLVGAITQFEPNVSGGDGGIDLAMLGGMKYHTDRAVVGIEARLVDAQTGKVLHVGSGLAEIVNSNAGASTAYQGLSVGAGGWSRTPIGVATKEAGAKAIEALIEGLKQMPFEAGVVSVNGQKIFIDAGSKLNLKVGDALQIVHRGEAITGPDGTVLGYDETLGGWITLVSVQEMMSIGTLGEGESPKVGDRARITPKQ